MGYATKTIGEIPGFRRVDAVCTELGLSRAQLLDRIHDDDVQTFRHPSDRRVKLVSVEDAQRLMQPVPDRPRPIARV
jgi:hypothetical protein